MALHAVESTIDAERGSHRMPQPVASYMAFARNLPSQFDDHAWLVETPAGTAVACGFCWSNSAGDGRVMECDLLVQRERRRQGIGTRLLATIAEETVHEGRSLLTWSTFDAVPAGDAFSRRFAAHKARENRTSELVLADLDATFLESWSRAEQARGRGYHLEMVDGAFPPHLRGDVATLHHIMQTAPREDLDAGEVLIDAEFVAELDRALAEAGRTRWTLLVRDGEGACVGGTEITFEPSDPSTVFQQNTGIDVSHRGLGLAKWAKSAMLERLRQHPAARRVRTDNASSNASMLAINDALGFKLVNTRTEWQVDVADLLQALRAPGGSG